MHEFRWRSAIGGSVALFSLYGVLSLLASVAVPLSMHLGGLAGTSFLVLGLDADSAFLARPVESLGQTDPRLAMFLVNFMDTMCAYMASFGLVQFGIAWFALRRGERWALWTLLIANLAVFPYYVAVAAAYVQLGISVASPGFSGFFLGTLAIVLVATALGWAAIRRRPLVAGA